MKTEETQDSPLPTSPSAPILNSTKVLSKLNGRNVFINESSQGRLPL